MDNPCPVHCIASQLVPSLPRIDFCLEVSNVAARNSYNHSSFFWKILYFVSRKISAFNTSGNNPITQLSRDEISTGSYVLNFVSDLPVAGGLVSRIIIDVCEYHVKKYKVPPKDIIVYR